MGKHDKRWRVRAAKDPVPRWPLALELAQGGLPVGVWLAPLLSGEHAAVVVEGDGVLWEVRRLPLRQLVRWCLNRHLRIFHSLADYVQAEAAGFVIGWVPGQMVEHKDGRQWLAPAVLFECGDLAESSAPRQAAYPDQAEYPDEASAEYFGQSDVVH